MINNLFSYIIDHEITDRYTKYCYQIFFLKNRKLVKHNECFDKVLSLQKFHSLSDYIKQMKKT